MFHQRLSLLRNRIAPLIRWPLETIAIYLAVAFFPTLIVIGAVVDYSRAINYKTAIQVALDAAALSGGRNGKENWTKVALKTFNTKVSSKYDGRARPTFVQNPSTGNYIGTVRASWPTSALNIINISSISVRVTAAVIADGDNAFILNPNHVSPKSDVWRVNNFSGDAYLTTSGGRRTVLRAGAPLNPGSSIHTGQNGRVLLVRGENTVLIATNSVIGVPLQAAEGMLTTIYQWAGSILYAVEKRSYQHFEVDTPYLAAVVRGTRFRVTVNKDAASVQVLRGQVEVTDFKSGQYAFVGPEQAAEVSTQRSVGLSLSGSGTLSAVRQGMPRMSSLNPTPPSNQHLSAQNDMHIEHQVYIPSKAENERVPRWSKTDSTIGDWLSSGLSALGQFFSNLFGNAIIGIVFAIVLGASVGAAAHGLRRRRKQKSI